MQEFYPVESWLTYMTYNMVLNLMILLYFYETSATKVFQSTLPIEIVTGKTGIEIITNDTYENSLFGYSLCLQFKFERFGEAVSPFNIIDVENKRDFAYLTIKRSASWLIIGGQGSDRPKF